MAYYHLFHSDYFLTYRYFYLSCKYPLVWDVDDFSELSYYFSFTEEDLITIGLDLFSAGSESTSNSIEFVLLYMILYPEIQAKVQAEIDQVLGRARKPNLDDKAK